MYDFFSQFPWGFLKILFIYLLFIYLFRERGKEGEREGEKYQGVVASHVPPTGDLTCNPGMCPDWELNPGPYGSQAGPQSTQQHQPGPLVISYNILSYFLSSSPRDCN